MKAVCILDCLVLIVMSGAAVREYVPQQKRLSWDTARQQCQECFKDLVALTPDNIQTVAQKLFSDSWVGLRKNSNSSQPWSSWANGDRLIFQNWYPGWPLLEHSPVNPIICNCTCQDDTCFIEMNKTMSFISPSSEEEYSGDMETRTEDSCVAMLSLGAWVEKNCSDLLPYICYEDHGGGEINVTNINSTWAFLTWPSGPGNVSHYRVLVNNVTEVDQLFDTMLALDNLTEGSHYSVHVYPIKCGRDLIPLQVDFCTEPNKVSNLTATNESETSVTLSWRKPDGNVDFYRIDVPDKNRSFTVSGEFAEIKDLTPGNQYNLSITAGVMDKLSEQFITTVFTKPGNVTNLRVSMETNTSLMLHWDPPAGNTTGFMVKAMDDQNVTLYNKTLDSGKTHVTVGLLPMGTQVTLQVTALGCNTLEGEAVTKTAATYPGHVSNLSLTTACYSLCAIWEPPKGNYSFFSVKLQLNGSLAQTKNVTGYQTEFYGLFTAANYSVTVITVSGYLESPPEDRSEFTQPKEPTDAAVTMVTASEMTWRWEGPPNITAPVFLVNISPPFNSSFELETTNTSHTFRNLQSGTKYELKVKTKAGPKLWSTPKIKSHFTVADKREMSLSLVCSSHQPCLCDREATRTKVFDKLRSYFEDVLGEGVFWELETRNSSLK